MTAHRSFKQLVRARMARTGESYTTARAVLITAREPDVAGRPVFPTSDDRIRERTGRGWEQWFDLLDDAGMRELPHREIARWVAAQLDVVPLAWAAQAVTGAYERARRGRAVGQHADGFTVTASRTIAVAAEAVFAAFVDEHLGDAPLRERTSTRPRSARFDWADGPERVAVTFDVKTAASTTVSVLHSRIADADGAAARKTWWRERLGTLKARLENGRVDV